MNPQDLKSVLASGLLSFPGTDFYIFIPEASISKKFTAAWIDALGRAMRAGARQA